MILSIIVTVFNKEKSISRCIESVVKQKFKNYELILVDDGSTDQSGNICDEYAYKYKSISVIHKQNEGLGSARVEGIKNSIGEYIGFVDADDWIEDDLYERMFCNNSRNMDADIIISGYILDYLQYCSNPFYPGKERYIDKKDALREMFMVKEYNWSLCDKAYKRVLFERTDLLYSWLPSYCEDTYANWKLFDAANTFYYMPIYHYHYCVDKESMMHSSFNREKFVYFDVWDKIASFALKRNDDLLLNNVVKTMVTDGVVYLREAELHYNIYEEKIESIVNLLKSWLKISGFDFKDVEYENVLKNRLNYVLKTKKEYELRIEEKKNSIVDFFNVNDYIYLYGSGQIAKETVDFIKSIGFDIKSVVVTKKGKDNCFMGYKIQEIKDINNTNIKIGFILAMNAKNTLEVISSQQTVRTNNYIDIGKYSFYY